MLILTSFIRGSYSADCTSAKIGIAVDQVINAADGKALPTTFADGSTYTIACKYSSTHVFTNDVRGQAAVNLDAIDTYSTSTNKQAGTITVKCSSGKFLPDIWAAVGTWCAVGCSPIPENMHQYWSVEYPDGSASMSKGSAPVNPDLDKHIKVSCRAGYAPQMYQLGHLSTRCLSTGYTPDLSNLVKCTAGCTDIAALVFNGKVLSEKSPVTGAAPYNIGSVATIQCSDGYLLSGAYQVTCTSQQRWSHGIPRCIINSSQPLLYSTFLWTLCTVLSLMTNHFFL